VQLIRTNVFGVTFDEVHIRKQLTNITW